MSQNEILNDEPKQPIHNKTTLTKEIKKLIIPKNTDNNDNPELSYDEYISSQIDILQNEAKTYLQTQINSINQIYSSFKNSVTFFILRKMQTINEIININETNIHVHKFVYANISQHIHKLFDIHNNIISNLKENFNILTSFLQIDKYLYKNKPPEEFLISNLSKIHSNWLFSKIDFSQYNLNSFYHSDLLNQQVMQYINIYPENKFTSYKITKDNSNNNNNTSKRTSNETPTGNTVENKDHAILQKNKNILNKLQIANLKDCGTVLPEGTVFDKVKKLNMNTCPLKIISLHHKNFPSLTNLTLTHCNINDINEFDIIRSFQFKLQKLSITKMEITTTIFNKIMSSLINNDELRNNITHLSFAENLITIVDFSQFLFLPNKLHKLQEMNFEKNQIYKFHHNPELTPQLKVLNMSVNAFGKTYFTQFKKEKTFLFLSNNFYLTSTANSKQYYDILKYQLENIEYNLDYLTFNGLFTKETRQYLPDIHIHKSIQINVRKLDLSNCSLDDETIINFFKANPGFLELRYLRLNDNYLSDNFFHLFVQHNLSLNMPKLKHVLLTSNEIEGEKMSSITNFILDNKALTRLVLLRNPLSKRLRFVKNEKDNNNNNSRNEFMEMLQMVDEINKRCRGDNRNYVDYTKNEKGIVLRFDAGEKFSVYNYNIDDNSYIEMINNK